MSRLSKFIVNLPYNYHLEIAFNRLNVFLIDGVDNKNLIIMFYS